MQSDVLKDYQKVLDPELRLKLVTKQSNTVVIDSNIPPKRYYRSGLEMIRMANVYLDEGSLENAFILYMKFMTLFLEKIRSHPEFSSVPPSLKAMYSQKLREVLPKAELLKGRLLEQYQREYDKFLADMERREEVKREKRQLEEKQVEKRAQKESTARGLEANNSITEEGRPIGTEEQRKMFQKISVVPPLGESLYPSTPSCLTGEESLAAGALLSSNIPSVNRSTKPSSSRQSLLATPSLTVATGQQYSASGAAGVTTRGGGSEGGGGGRLRSVIVPGNLMSNFLQIAQANTSRDIETCAVLAGKLRQNELVISHLLVPVQCGTPDSCTTQREEDLFDFQDQNELITCGWIHTHPSQTAFLSSVDLHTHCSYQLMMPEALAIVCAPRYAENAFFCLTPDYGLDYIAGCRQTGFHPHPSEPPLYMVAKHCEVDPATSVQVVDFRR